MIEVVLSHPDTGYCEKTLVEDASDRRCFIYVDKQGAQCEFCIYDEGLSFFRQAEDHMLELHLKQDAYAKIITEEGILRFDVKVVDFKLNSDILIVRYIINDENRTIEIKYY